MTDLSDYTDIRELMDSYKRVPCKECDDYIYATNDFRWDEWYCPAHVPERVGMHHLRDTVTVRL